MTVLRCSHRHHVFNSATSEWYDIICQATLSWLPFVNFERALGTDNRKKECLIPTFLYHWLKHMPDGYEHKK